MSILQGTRFLERQRFFNGQRLFASDLQGLEEFHREMRWLHNQSLHQPGIGIGYAVGGDTGASEVSIAPGYAIDALGREIILVAAATEPIPPVANDGFGEPVHYDLTVSYPADSDLEESETRDGICLPRGVIRLEERPVFCWVRLGPPPDLQPIDATLKQEIQSGLRIRLARAEVFNCVLKGPLSVSQRRNARPTTQPYVACGRESLADAEIAAQGGDSEGFFLQVNADTSAAGFRTRPNYFVTVAGPRLLESNGSQFLVDGLTSLAIPPDRPLTRLGVQFFSFLIPVLGTPPSQDVVIQMIRDAWHVDWIGVEG